MRTAAAQLIVGKVQVALNVGGAHRKVSAVQQTDEAASDEEASIRHSLADKAARTASDVATEPP